MPGSLPRSQRENRLFKIRHRSPRLNANCHLRQFNEPKNVPSCLPSRPNSLPPLPCFTELANEKKTSPAKAARLGAEGRRFKSAPATKKSFQRLLKTLQASEFVVTTGEHAFLYALCSGAWPLAKPLKTLSRNFPISHATKSPHVWTMPASWPNLRPPSDGPAVL